jgi:2-C-methyl-D-erythritol 4-phosphate cytidylyltransferase
VDSLKLTDGKGNILNPVSRDDLYRAETPQVFEVKKLIDAYKKSAEFSATDDAEIMRLAGFPVEVVDSGEFNLKLTCSSDLDFLKIFYTAGK